MRSFTLPLNEADRLSLVCGENILLSGVMYTARDAAHLKMAQALKNGEPLPFDLTSTCLYYAGPSPTAEGKIIGSIGPTTAGRMDAITPMLIEQGLRVTIGKGQRNLAVKQCMKQYEAVYLGAIGGAGARYATCVKAVEIIAYPELQSEAIRKLTVEDFPVTVIIDAKGNDRYDAFAVGVK